MSDVPVAGDPFHLERFVQAQTNVIEEAGKELAAGRKRSHWMWFVFPQLRGLGHSGTAQLYGIASLPEAEAYLRHSLLGPRLVECTSIVNGITGSSVHDIFGSPDDLKFRSCMSLFCCAPQAPAVFQQALNKYFGGVADTRTLMLLQNR